MYKITVGDKVRFGGIALAALMLELHHPFSQWVDAMDKLHRCKSLGFASRLGHGIVLIARCDSAAYCLH